MNRADQRNFHYIYKITREDGKYYIGLHSTNDLEDGYFGSGQLLWKSIKKHGKEKHSKEILEFLPSRIAVKLREAELVNIDTLRDPMCMNITQGGQACNLTPKTEEHLRKLAGKSHLGGAANAHKLRTNPEHAAAFSAKQREKRFSLSEEAKEKIRQSKIGRPRSAECKAKISATKRGKTGPKHTDESRLKIKAALIGKPKSQEHKQKLREAALKRARLKAD